MKKVLSLLIVLCMVICSVPTFAEEEQSIPETWQIVYDWRNETSLFWAEIDGETCTIKAVAHYENDELFVPYKDSLYVKEHPSYKFGDPVEVSTFLIDKNALKNGAEGVSTITFAEGYETLPAGLCEGMYNLKTVNLPEGVYAIGESTFEGCENLEQINFSNIKHIGKSAFEGCTSLKKIEGLTADVSIDTNAFKGTAATTLTEVGKIEVDEAAGYDIEFRYNGRIHYLNDTMLNQNDLEYLLNAFSDESIEAAEPIPFSKQGWFTFIEKDTHRSFNIAFTKDVVYIGVYAPLEKLWYEGSFKFKNTQTYDELMEYLYELVKEREETLISAVENQDNIVEMSVEALSWYKEEDSARYDFTTTDKEKIKAVLDVINECRYIETKGVLMSEAPTFVITFKYSDGKEVSKTFKESTIKVGDKKYQLNEDDYWRLEECIEELKIDLAGENVFSDITESDSCYEAVKGLSELGVMQGYEDGTFNPEGTLSRAEAAAIMVRLLNLDEGIRQGKTLFTDVDSTHWASGYINEAVENGIIIGQGDGTFAPDEYVTYSQAVKMLVCALGYEPMAVANGGWNDGGYLFTASRIGLSTGISGTSNEKLTRGKMAQLVFRALDIDFMEWVEQTSGVLGEMYRVCEGETILTEYWDYEKLEGVIKVEDSRLMLKVTKNYNENGYYIVGRVFTIEPKKDEFIALDDEMVMIYVKKTDNAKNKALFAIKIEE